MIVWLAKIIRSLFLLLDKVVYWAVNTVYQLFMMLSETGVFTQETIRTFASRIYVFLGVFMLFKVSFSLITYILNPDDLTDKGKGVNKLLTNFFVVLVGIIAVPYVFQAAFSLQTIVLRDNIVGNIILGTVSGEGEKSASETAVDYIETGGQKMSFSTLSAFLRLNPEVVGEECSSLPIVEGEVSSDCEDNSVLQTESESGNGTVEKLLEYAYVNDDVNTLLDGGLVNLRVDVEDSEGNTKETWLFEYTFLISTIAGGFLAWILLIFCFDIATRSVKLGFLQLIAPVPIISYVDPKSGKDGMFKKWVKECTSTYISLFGRLVAIYFAVFVISQFTSGGIIDVTTGTQGEIQKNIFVKVFIIFGALMFAKQLPELISNITGFKLDGGFTLNPMKKIGQSPFAAGLVGAAGGFAGGLAANSWALGNKIKKDGFKNAFTDGKGGWKGIRNAVGNTFSPFAGGMSAGFRGAGAGLSSGGKGSALAAASTGIRRSSDARNLRDKGYGALDKARDRATDLAGVKFSTGTTSELKNRTNLLQQQLANSRRNEQAMTDALNRRISESGNKMAGLLKTFDGSVSEGADGKPVYDKKTYTDYIESMAKQHATNSGLDWNVLDSAVKDSMKIDIVNTGIAANEAEFNSFNELYEARNAEDIKGRGLEKEINDIKDDMGSFKDRKKK